MIGGLKQRRLVDDDGSDDVAKKNNLYWLIIKGAHQAQVGETNCTIYLFIYLFYYFATHNDLQANFTSRVTLSHGSTLPALLTCFVMRDILLFYFYLFYFIILPHTMN